jgi:hypothetical protein
VQYNKCSFEDLEDLFVSQSEDFEKFLDYLKSKEKKTMETINDEKLKEIDQNVSSLLPGEFKRFYAACKTPPDGHCLWHTFSLNMFGDLRFTDLLRCVSIYILFKEKDYFKSKCRESIIHSQRNIHLNPSNIYYNDELNDLVEEEFERILLMANKKQWGNEYHILTMAKAFNSKVYVYSRFHKELLNKTIEEIQRDRRCSNHLVYKPNNQTNRFLCAFFGSAHYTSIIPIISICIELEPKNNLFE